MTKDARSNGGLSRATHPYNTLLSVVLRGYCCRAAALITAIAFFCTSIPIEKSYAQALKPAIPQKILNTETFSLPTHLGRILDSWSPTRQSTNSQINQTIIHVQDAHCNYAAQKKIAEIVKYLNNEYSINAVNLEGGKGDYDLSIFTRIKDLRTREKVTDYFVKEGLVNGAEYFASNNPGKVSLWGVEETGLYIENLNAYRDVLQHKEEIDKHLKILNHIISNFKFHIYPEELLEADRKYGRYKAGNIDLKEYVGFLVMAAEKRAIDITAYPNLFVLHEALRQEGEIDFKIADIERSRLIDVFRKTLSKIELERLVIKTVEFKSDKIKEQEFYAYLVNKARFLNLDLAAFSALQKYVTYIDAYASIDKTKIPAELDSLDRDIKETLFTSEIERRLNALSKNLAILRNMFNVTLIPDDYKYYIKNRESFSVSEYVSFIAKNAPLYKIQAKPDKNISNLNSYREKMQRFYECSKKRDEVFLRNLRWGQVSGQAGVIPGRDLSPSERTTALVTGGFHAENLHELFKKNNISYISIMPNFKNEGGYECPYFKILSGKKSLDIANALPSVLGNALAIPDPLSPAMMKAVLDHAALAKRPDPRVSLANGGMSPEGVAYLALNESTEELVEHVTAGHILPEQVNVVRDALQANLTKLERFDILLKLNNNVRALYEQFFQGGSKRSPESAIAEGCMSVNSVLGVLLNGRGGWKVDLIYKEIGDDEHWYLLVNEKFIVDAYPSWLRLSPDREVRKMAEEKKIIIMTTEQAESSGKADIAKWYSGPYLIPSENYIVTAENAAKNILRECGLETISVTEWFDAQREVAGSYIASFGLEEIVGLDESEIAGLAHVPGLQTEIRRIVSSFSNQSPACESVGFDGSERWQQLNLMKKQLERLIEVREQSGEKSILIYDIGIGRKATETEKIIKWLNRVLRGMAGKGKITLRGWRIDLIAVDTKKELVSAAENNMKIRQLSEASAEWLKIYFEHADALNATRLTQISRGKGDFIFYRHTDYSNMRAQSLMQRLIKLREGNLHVLRNLLRTYIARRNIFRVLSKAGSVFVIEPISGPATEGEDVGEVSVIPGTRLLTASELLSREPSSAMSLADRGTGIYRISNPHAIYEAGLNNFLEKQPSVALEALPEGVYSVDKFPRLTEKIIESLVGMYHQGLRGPDAPLESGRLSGYREMFKNMLQTEKINFAIKNGVMVGFVRFSLNKPGGAAKVGNALVVQEEWHHGIASHLVDSAIDAIVRGKDGQTLEFEALPCMMSFHLEHYLPSRRKESSNNPNSWYLEWRTQPVEDTVWGDAAVATDRVALILTAHMRPVEGLKSVTMDGRAKKANKISEAKKIYDAAEALVPAVAKLIRRDVPTYDIAPIPYEEANETFSYARKIEQLLQKANHQIHLNHYRIGNNENGYENLIQQVDGQLENFIKDVEENPGARMIIRTVDGIAGTRSRIISHLMSNQEGARGVLTKMVARGELTLEQRDKIMSRIKIIEMDIGREPRHLNTVIDLFVDLTAIEIDRYVSGYYQVGDAGKDRENLKKLKNGFLSLLKLSVDNFSDLEAAALNLDSNRQALAENVLHLIFTDKKLIIHAIDWESLRDLKKRREEILYSL